MSERIEHPENACLEVMLKLCEEFIEECYKLEMYKETQHYINYYNDYQGDLNNYRRQSRDMF